MKRKIKSYCAYYCAGDIQQYAANCCSWCGSPDAKDLEGCDGVRLCDTCLKDLEEMEEEIRKEAETINNAPVV